MNSIHQLLKFVLERQRMDKAAMEWFLESLNSISICKPLQNFIVAYIGPLCTCSCHSESLAQFKVDVFKACHKQCFVNHLFITLELGIDQPGLYRVSFYCDVIKTYKIGVYDVAFTLRAQNTAQHRIHMNNPNEKIHPIELKWVVQLSKSQKPVLEIWGNVNNLQFTNVRFMAEQLAHEPSRNQ